MFLLTAGGGEGDKKKERDKINIYIYMEERYGRSAFQAHWQLNSIAEQKMSVSLTV